MSNEDSWAASDLRSALLQKAFEDRPGAPPEALSAPTKRSLNFLQNYVLSYDTSDPELADDIEDDPLFNRYFSRMEGHAVFDSKETGNVSSMKAIAGRGGNDRLDLSSWQAIDELEDLWDPDDRDSMLNLMVYAPLPPEGPTGVGKTDFGYSVIEAGQRAYPDLKVASNNTSDDFEDIQSWTALEDWLQKTSGVKAFLLDEAAQVLQFADMNEGKALSQLIKLLRKYNCHLIVISHTGKDIPKDIRRMVLLCRKESKKKATIGVGLNEVNGDMQIDRELAKFGRIPETRLEFDSITDTGSFVFDNDDEDENIEEKPRCQAETNAGNDCPNDAKYPVENPVVCQNHRHKADDLAD